MYNKTTTAFPSLPHAIGSYATALYKGHPWITGGRDGNKDEIMTSFLYDYDEEKWVYGPPMDVTRYYHCIEPLDDISRKYIFIGGTVDGTSYSDSVSVYDWIDDTWTPENPLTNGRSRVACGQVTMDDGKKVIVAAGGRT